MVHSSAVRVSAQHGPVDALKAWLDAGGDANDDTHDKSPQCKHTLLSYAAMGGNCDAVRLLLARGADPNKAEADSGLTPLHRAARRGRTGAASLLLLAGAAVDARTRVLLPEGAAQQSGNYRDEGAERVSGRTPLILAVCRGHPDVLRLLLSRGADPDAEDNGGRTAMMLVTRHGLSHPGRRDEPSEDYLNEARKKREAAALLGRVQICGGWKKYAIRPRRSLLVLRLLCERDRAKAPETNDHDALQTAVLSASSLEEAQSVARAFAPTPPGILARLFPSSPPENTTIKKTRASSARARADAPGTELPKEVFWLILSFWRHEQPTGVAWAHFADEWDHKPYGEWEGASSGYEELYE